MIFEYKCEECGKITEYKKPYEQEAPDAIGCEHCSGIAYKRPFGANIIVPEDFKSVRS
ncbi:MAG TPA: hypothetical protein P5136_00580 [Methanofastidiosum sp.]|nr:hypothetical protein [Methanofastidiosum sp.]